MLMGGLGVTVRILAMVLSRHSVFLCLVMFTLVVMMCRFKVVMGRCVMMLAGRVLLFRHAELS